MSDGVVIRHETARSQIYLVPLLWKPYERPDRGVKYVIDDCVCNNVHPCSTLHIWVDHEGRALVAPDMIGQLKKAGETGFKVVGHTGKPPSIEIFVPREQVDYDNAQSRIANMISKLDRENQITAKPKKGLR